MDRSKQAAVACAKYWVSSRTDLASLLLEKKVNMTVLCTRAVNLWGRGGRDLNAHPSPNCINKAVNRSAS